MLLNSPLPETIAFVDEISSLAGDVSDETFSFSYRQKRFISFCMTAMLIVGSFCLEKFQRASFRYYGARALGWMLLHSKIPWNDLWNASVLRMLKIVGKNGILVVDDTDRYRSKCAKKLFGLFKTKDKTTGGYAMSQNIVFLVFVTKYLSIPVGFEFFQPDPVWKAWCKVDKELRERKIPKAQRPRKPPRNQTYPMRSTITVRLLEKFKKLAPGVEIDAVIGDAAYMTIELKDAVAKTLPGTQFISQLHKNYLVSDKKGINRGKSIDLESYFKNKKACETEISLRGVKKK